MYVHWLHPLTWLHQLQQAIWLHCTHRAISTGQLAETTLLAQAPPMIRRSKWTVMVHETIWSLLIISTFDTCTDLHISICCKSYHALCWKDCTSQANSYRMMLKFYKFSTICENISTNAACSVRMQQIHKIISTKSSKIAIRKNLDPRKFNAIRYVALYHLITIWRS